MIADVAAVLGTAAFGAGSALVPLLNAEAYAVAAALASPSLWLAAALAASLAAGQTAGKLVWFGSGRRGVAVRHRRKALAAVGAEAPAVQEKVRLGRLRARLCDRRSSAGLVLLAGSVGMPPLALVSVAAGATGMRLRDFVACCFLGRLARFGVLLVPIALV